MKARSLVLVLFVIASLFLVSGCGLTGPGTYREYYGEAIHTYTAPSTPKLEDVPKQFLRDDDTNYILYLEDAIVAPSSYDTSLLSAFFRTKMCSIVTGAGYQCRDMSNNPITGSLFSGITGASVSKITGAAVAASGASVPLYGCRKDAGSGYDHYVSNVYPCSMKFGSGHLTQRVLGSAYSTQVEGSKPLRFCYRSGNPGEYIVGVGDACPAGSNYDAGPGISEILGYVYDSPRDGAVPATQCKMPGALGDEHYVVDGTVCVRDPNADTPVLTFYVYPICTDTDGGKNLNVKGTVTVPSSDPNKPFEDSCVDTYVVNEFYCDSTNYAHGMADERITCPSGQACVNGACTIDPAVYRIDMHKGHRHLEAERKINYDIEARNSGLGTPNEEGVVVITDLLPAGVSVDAVSPAPSIVSGRTLKWVFDGWDNRDGYEYDTKFDTHRGYTVYRSNGRFRIWVNVTIDTGITGILVNKANVTILGVLKGSVEDQVDVRAGTGTTPAATPNMVIVGEDTDIPGRGGDISFVETPYCPRGSRKFGEIFEFHGYNNEVGRRWAFCARPGVYGQINTCSVEDSSDVNPWTTVCEPFLCPSGMSAFGGLIKHGYYVRPGLNTYKYINMYSRICLSTDALNTGTVKTCGNNNDNLGETGECDTTQWKDDSDGLTCPAGQSQVQNGLVTDPVTSAYHIARDNGAPIWEFRYNNVCADFKTVSASANSPWDNGFACSVNTDCVSGYCNGATKVCEVAPVAPAQNMVIVGTDTYMPGKGGNLASFPDPVCPYGTSSIGQIHEFHGYNNEVGRKWKFCVKPGITGSILTCENTDGSSVNPWSSDCNPGTCPAGTTALAGLIMHGDYVRPGLHTFSYINRYSRVCLSNNAIYSGHVQSCGNQDTYKGETGECDTRGYKATAGGLSCQPGEEPVDTMVNDPVVSAHELVSDEFKYWEFRYNRLCIDFKESIPYCGDNIVQSGEQCEADANCASGQTCSNCVCVSSAGPPWANGYPCTVNTNCVSGYCSPTTNLCAAAPGTPTSYKVSIPSTTVPASFTNFATWKSVLVGTCNDNGHVAAALGTAGCAALTSGKAVLLLTHNPYRLVIAAYDSTGVAAAINVLRNGATYNVHGPRVDITYSGTTVIGVTFPHCSDGQRNFDETGTDCGGSCSACAGAAPTCNDNTRNQGETGVDCGGPCAACTSYPPVTSGGGGSGSDGGGGRRGTPQPVSQAGSAECYDDWICTAWTVCSAAGLQTRTCSFNDYPDCTLIIQKPSEQQSCRPAVVSPPVVPVENCFDGMQNQNEEGIDCGGMCAPCPGKASWLVPVIIVLVIAALAIGFLIYYDKFLKKPDVLSPLRKYVKDARGKSIPDARIRQILQNQGWSQSDIGKVMGKK